MFIRGDTAASARSFPLASGRHYSKNFELKSGAQGIMGYGRPRSVVRCTLQKQGRGVHICRARLEGPPHLDEMGQHFAQRCDVIALQIRTPECADPEMRHSF